MKRAISFALALTLALLSGCASGQRVAPAPTPTPQVRETVTVTDHLGRQVTVPCAPERTAALIGSFAHVWTLAGGSLCACANDGWTQFADRVDLEGAVDLGKTSAISLELLLSAQPELVLASCNTALDLELLPVLEELGIPVLFFEVTGVEDYLSMLDLCTQVTGRRDLYEKNGAAVAAQVGEVRDKAAGQDRRPTVLYLRASASGVKAKGGRGSVLGTMLTDLGCVNIADTDGSLLEDLSIERILADDPEYIFLVLQGNDEAAVGSRLERELTGDPAWSSLTAVREGRLYFMDQKLYNLKPNDRWGEAYEGLYHILYD